jgi:hypothetical protein
LLLAKQAKKNTLAPRIPSEATFAFANAASQQKNKKFKNLNHKKEKFQINFSFFVINLYFRIVDLIRAVI